VRKYFVLLLKYVVVTDSIKEYVGKMMSNATINIKATKLLLQRCCFFLVLFLVQVIF